jgi:hypothetical protein
MHKDVRAIRATLARVRDIHMSHTRRDQKLRIVRDMIRAVWERYRDEGHTDAMMLVDHLRAAWVLCHAQQPTGDHQTLEEHGEVRQRLWLADEVLEFLILKLEEDQQAPERWHPLEGIRTEPDAIVIALVEEQSARDTDEIPF